MCKWGTDTQVRVKVAAHLSSTGEEKWRDFGIDSCIAPIVKALQEGGIDMLGSCCGHGKTTGWIDLADGRRLEIHQPDHDPHRERTELQQSHTVAPLSDSTQGPELIAVIRSSTGREVVVVRGHRIGEPESHNSLSAPTKETDHE